MRIRKTLEKDLNELDKIFNAARSFMAATGNPTQWNLSYPTSEVVAQDIKDNNAYVCVDDNDKPLGTFALLDYESAYDNIDGSWISNEPYVVIHRLATKPSMKVGSFIITHLQNKYPHIKIDTHQDNKVMQGLLDKFNFKRCGIITIPGHGARIAFEFLRN